MSRILRRPMFRGGRVDGRGTGITSGLSYQKGGRVGYDVGGSTNPRFVNLGGGSTATSSPAPTGRWGRIKNWMKGTPSWLSGAGPELSAARSVPWGTTGSYVAGAFAPTGIMAYLNRPRTAAEKKVMQDYGSVDETWTEDDYARYDADRKAARNEGEEISFTDAIFMDPESGTYPKIFGRYEDIEKRKIAAEKAKKIANEGGNIETELTQEEKDILGLKDTIKTLKTQLEDALKPKKSKELSKEEKIAKIKENEAMFREIYGSGRGEDVSRMLMTLAAKGLKPEATTKSMFGEFFEEESKAPSERKKYNDAAAQAAIQSFLTGEKTMAEVDAYLSKVTGGEKAKLNILTDISKGQSLNKRIADKGGKYPTKTAAFKTELPLFLEDNEIPYKGITYTDEEKVQLEGEDAKENVGEVFVDVDKNVVFIVVLENGVLKKKYLNK